MCSIIASKSLRPLQRTTSTVACSSFWARSIFLDSFQWNYSYDFGFKSSVASIYASTWCTCHTVCIVILTESDKIMSLSIDL